jgi:site-specific DNA recombinase
MKADRKIPEPSPENESHSILMSQFAKNIKASAAKTNNCIIYTRVSTKEQEQGYSLDAQRKDCDEFAKKNGYCVLAHFGGTFESAQTDERKEFSRMLRFVKGSKEKITYIIVHMLDRFSRSGANSIYLKDQLKDIGIYIQSVRQPVDSSTSSGDFQQNIQMIFSHYDNQVRKEKCMSGTKEALEGGEWVTKPPFGYDIVYSNGIRKILLNEKGKIIRKAFHWKAEGYTTEEILQKLKTHGIQMYHQRISRMFRNPFYCGLLSHVALQGKLVKGNHEKCVSQEIFLKANQVLQKNPQGYSHTGINEPIPLKNYVKCDNCGNNMPGYMVKKKKIWYYKCRVKGCCNNKSAKEMHAHYRHFLDLLTVKEEYRTPLKNAIIAKIGQLQSEHVDAQESLTNRLKEGKNKLERLEERYAFEEIDRSIYDKFAGKLKLELNEIHEKLQLSKHKVSNPENFADRLLNYAQNLREIWDYSDFKDRQKLQNMLFPSGITYNKKTDQCRTTALDKVFGWTALKQAEMEVIEKGESPILMKDSPYVAGSGVEPETSGL